jgi:predicted ATPase
VIATPDQRLRVFVSSTLEELAAEREAAREAIESLRLTPVMFELGARPHPPRELYAAYLDQSDVFVGIYGESYGWVAPETEISGLEEEYRLAADKPQLLYVKREAPARDERLAALVAQIESEGAVSYRTYADSEELRAVVADDLALLLTERFQGRGQPVRARLPVRLPAPVDRFVGREQELQQLEVLLADRTTRLVTVTGPGGVGKTRAAIEAAHRVRSLFGDRAHFVALTSVSDVRLVDAVIQESFGIPSGAARSPVDALLERLRDADLLLVLDNFEHVLEAAPVVARLLEASSAVTVLATSRAPLRLRGEHEFSLAPLPLAPDRRDARDGSSAAAELFVDRARAANPSFAVGADDVEAIDAICRRLDGLPLAIELVAAQARVLPPTSIHDRLGRGLSLSARGGRDYPDRQQTLHAAIEWSFGLADRSEQELLARLSVFRGGCGLEATEAVCADGGDVLEPLSLLVEKSLVMRVSDEPRFSMLSTIRDFAAAKLAERSETNRIRARHADFYLALVEDAGMRLNAAGDHSSVLETLDREEANVREALSWLLAQGEHERVARAGWSLLPYWSLRERLAEGRRWMRDVLATGALAKHARARALTVNAVLAFWASEYPAAIRAASEALPFLKEARDDAAVSLAQIPLGVAEAIGGDREAGVALLEDSGERASEVGSEWNAVVSRLALGWALNAAETDAPIEPYEDTVERARTFGHELETLALGSFARRAALNGHAAEAKSVLAEVLRRVLELRVRIAIGLYIDLVADLAAREGDDGAAARFSGAAAAVFEATGAPIPPLVGDRGTRIRTLRERLGETFDVAHQAGADLPAEQAGIEAIAWLQRDS